MGYTDGVGTEVLTQLLKIMVTEFTGRHLDAHLMQGRIFPGIEMCPMDWDILRFAQRADKRLVAVGLFSTKPEIAMGGFYPIAQLFQDQQQRHTVGPATQCHNMQAFLVQQALFYDETGNFTIH